MKTFGRRRPLIASPPHVLVSNSKSPRRKRADNPQSFARPSIRPQSAFAPPHRIARASPCPVTAPESPQPSAPHPPPEPAVQSHRPRPPSEPRPQHSRPAEANSPFPPESRSADPPAATTTP